MLVLNVIQKVILILTKKIQLFRIRARWDVNQGWIWPAGLQFDLKSSTFKKLKR